VPGQSRMHEEQIGPAEKTGQPGAVVIDVGP
jgi:hypothetical protein